MLLLWLHNEVLLHKWVKICKLYINIFIDNTNFKLIIMKRALTRSILIITLLLFGLNLHSQPPPGSGWNNVFGDEFGGSSINDNIWTVKNPNILGREPTFLRSQVIVSGGTLKIRNDYPNGGVPKGGWIESKAEFAKPGRPKYGYYEARLRINGPDNGKIWPSWWIWGNFRNGVSTTEFDLMEYSGSSTRFFNNKATSSHHSIGKKEIFPAFFNPNVMRADTTTPPDNASRRNAFQWHVWGLHWTPNEVSFYYDGVKYFSTTARGAQDAMNENEGLRLILSSSPHTFDVFGNNNGPGGFQGNNPLGANGAAKPGDNLGTLEVDWVRVWTGGTIGGNSGGGNTVVTLKKGNATGFSIDGNNGGANGQNVYLWSTNRNNINQQWIEINRGNGFYSYQKNNTNFCLDGGNGGANRQNVYLWTCSNNNQNQHWRKVNLGNGRVRLEKRNAPGFSIDGGNGGANGQNLYLWSSSNGNQNQHWELTSFRSNRNSFVGPINEGEDINQIDIYPNPSNGIFTVDFNTNVKNIQATLTDLSGRVVFKSTLNNEDSKSIDVQELPRGMYLLNLEGDRFKKQTKIILQ